MSYSGLNLPVVPKPRTRLMPAWVTDYTNAVRAMANATIAYNAQPPFGGGSFTFSGANAVLTLHINQIPTMNPNLLFNGTIATGKISGSAGSITVVNGVITGATNAT